jgi:uncharacterized protein (DUF58 family)
MLPPGLLKDIRRVHLRARRRVDSLFSGEYRSAFRGVGMEFEEVREYCPGDEVKTIDWNVTARSGRPHVKVYREERDLVVWLLLDMSGSGSFGTARSLVRETMTEAAALLAAAALGNNDRVGAILFTDRIERCIRPKKGSSHLWFLLRELFTFQPQRRGTDLTQALRFLRTAARRRCVAFVLSDFLDDGCAAALSLAARRHDLVGILLSDPAETELPRGGLARLRDLETGEEVVVDAACPKTVEHWGRVARLGRARRLERLRKAGADVLELATTEPVAPALERLFRRREHRIAR